MLMMIIFDVDRDDYSCWLFIIIFYYVYIFLEICPHTEHVFYLSDIIFVV